MIVYQAPASIRRRLAEYQTSVDIEFLRLSTPETGMRRVHE